MSEGLDQAQHYCRSCGAELRSGTTSCVSCGAKLGSNKGLSGWADSSKLRAQLSNANTRRLLTHAWIFSMFGILLVAGAIAVVSWGSPVLPWEHDYSITDVEGGETPNGASASKIYVQTSATSTEELKEISSEISREQEYKDFLWLEFYDVSLYETTAVVVDINSSVGEDFVGNPEYTVNGGEEQDGVYVLTGDQLDGYPSGQPGFQET